MVPPAPPLPVPRNLPFQAAGIQSSTLMSDSAVGLIVAATRQKAGTSVSVVPAGVTKLPAGTSSAFVNVVSATAVPAISAQLTTRGWTVEGASSEPPPQAATRTANGAAKSSRE